MMVQYLTSPYYIGMVDGFNHQVKITQGVLEEECSSMLSEFFRKLREKKKQEKAALKAAQENPEGEPE